MIRFVDMRSADIAGIRFAFWNTIVDAFVQIGDEQAWDTWDELTETAAAYKEQGVSGGLKRLRGICPDWVFVINEQQLPALEEAHASTS